MNKLGQTSHLFQWIFVLIAGGVLFGFLLNFGFKQSQQAETSAVLEISKALETILRSVERSSETFKRITLPSSTIEFTCDDTGSTYKIQGSPNTPSLQYTIVFSPRKVRGTEILTWTKDWRVPFKISSFLYLSGKKTQYIFINDTDFQTYQLLQDYPKNFTHIVLEPPWDGSFSYANYDHYRFIYINQDPTTSGTPLPPPPPNTEVSILATSGDPIDGTGSVYFYPYTGSPPTPASGKESFYLRRETLYAALFTPDFTTYTCNLRKALHRYRIAVELAKLWVENVSTDIGAGPCHDQLLNIQDSLNLIRDELKLITLTSGDQDVPHATQLLEEAGKIEILNEDLARGSCPQLY